MANVGLQIRLQSSGKYLRADSLNKSIKGTRVFNEIVDPKLLQKDIKEIADQLAEDVRNNILKAKRFDNRGRLKALKRSTIKQKGNARILINTGQLLNGVEVKKQGQTFVVKMTDKLYKVRRKAKSNRKKKSVGKSTIAISEIAGYLQNGTDRMPARPFFGTTKKRMKELVNAVVRQRIKQTR